MAHLGGISVEGELGVLGSLETGMGDKEDGHGAEGKLSHDQLLTNPDEAVKFVKETKVDALAIAMGTSHGAYKFTRKPDGDILAMNVIEEIHRKLPNTHLVMHGSSSVPQDLQDIINANGGKMKPTWGVPVSEIQRGIKNGVRKINIDTDNRMAMTGQIRKVLNDNPEEFDPRKYLKPAMEAMAKLCKQRLAGIQHRGPSKQDQEGADDGRNGQALRQGRTRSEGGVIGRALSSQSLRDAPKGAGPESITTVGAMDSGSRSARPGMTAAYRLRRTSPRQLPENRLFWLARTTALGGRS